MQDIHNDKHIKLVMESQNQNQNQFQVSVSMDLSRELEAVKRTSSPNCCIYRVPGKVRHLSNPEAYTPQLLSLGPLHHGSDRHKFQAMENTKRRYLGNFLHRTQVSLDAFVDLVQVNETKIRDCYADPLMELRSRELVKIVVVDAAFMVEFCLGIMFHDDDSAADSIMTSKHRIDFNVAQDFIMLENQLPFIILEEFLELGKSRTPAIRGVTMFKLFKSLCDVFWSFPATTNDNPARFESTRRPAHFLDFIWLSFVPAKPSPKPQGMVLNMLATRVSASELHHSGVRLTASKSKNLFDIKFENGTLSIPPLKLGKVTDVVFLNLMAFETLSLPQNYINDYIALLNFIVNSAGDVDLLSERKILQHVFERQRVCETVHRLYKDCLFDTSNYYFTPLVDDLNVYCSKPWRRCKATLEQDYFSNPWAAISIIAAAVLLLLSFIQTVCSILQLIKQ